MDVKVGDTVHVKGTVMEVRNAAEILVACAESKDCPTYRRALVTRQDIIAVERRPLQVGDRVAAGCAQGTILAMHNNEVWVNRDVFGCATFDVGQLRRL